MGENKEERTVIQFDHYTRNSFHFHRLVRPVSGRSVWLNGKHPLYWVLRKFLQLGVHLIACISGHNREFKIYDATTTKTSQILHI